MGRRYEKIIAVLAAIGGVVIAYLLGRTRPAKTSRVIQRGTDGGVTDGLRGTRHGLSSLRGTLGRSATSAERAADNLDDAARRLAGIADNVEGVTSGDGAHGDYRNVRDANRSRVERLLGNTTPQDDSPDGDDGS